MSVTRDEGAPKSLPAPRSKPGRPPRNGNGTDLDLRERILDIAEEQFSRRGYDAVSTRAVAKAVGATPAMIHYYFNSKRELFDAVFARRANVVNADRMAALYEYEKEAGGDVTVEGAIAAFLRPALAKFEEGPGWRNYLTLVAQVGNKHEWGGEVMTRSFDPVIQRLIEIIRKALPEASDVNLYWAYHFLSGALLLTLSETDRIDRLSSGKCRSTDIAAIEPRLVQFAAAGFRRVCEQKQHGAQSKKRRR
ncbi:MAG: TetR/AcrR family transcriptional regulator [Hyphomonadaceae bacterium]